LGAFLVLYAHAITVYGQEEWLAHQFKPRLELSSLGVEIFFIISGYLVTKSLLQTSNRWLFARKRWLRLWPALFTVTVLLCFCIGPLLSTYSLSDYLTDSKTWIFLIRNSLFWPVFQLPGVLDGTAVNSTFWTLLFEVLCYSILLLLGKSILLRYKNILLLLWLIAVVYKYWITIPIAWPTSIKAYEYGTTKMMFVFFSAAAWYLFSYNKKIPNMYIQWTSFICIVVYTVIPQIPQGFVVVRDVALVLFITEWGRSKAVIQWPSWDISYGTYLLGFTVELLLVHYCKAYLPSAFTVFVATLFLTIPLAFMLWHFIEKPALRFKETVLQQP
jgi:peptidoglycan/LPS O-acetylase OafA/YrhL